MYNFDRDEYERRMKWFLEARFGMFIHWGLYAIPARGEWVRSTEQMEEADYMRYFYEFDPRLYDPSTWVRAAKRAGMKYIIRRSITTAFAFLIPQRPVLSPPIQSLGGT